MKTKIFLIAALSIFCIFFSSCGGKKEKEAQIISVVVSDTNGVLTYDWSKAKTVGNTTIIPTGISIKEMKSMDGEILSERLLSREQRITADFEKQFNLQVLSSHSYGVIDSTGKVLPQVYLYLHHEAAPLISNQTIQRAEGLVDKAVDKVKEVWDGIKK
jgi:hypothetical protein